MRMGLSYDDVILVPKMSSVKSRKLVDTRTKLTRNISLNIPIVSANMDTVTESKMAIALARLGGIGIIHQFMSVDEQAAEVRKVKRSTSYIIEEPISLLDSCLLGYGLQILDEAGVSSALVVNKENILVGILTKRDILFEEDMDLPVSALMTGYDRLVTAPADTTFEQAKDILKKNRIEKLPLIDSDGRIKGLITTTDIVKLLEFPDSARDSKGRLLVGAAVGVKQGYLGRARALIESGADLIVVDIAHGHSGLAVDTIKGIKAEFPDVDVLAGNIATAEGARDLIAAGADGLKVGVGPGAACITRIVAGAGVPQVTAVMDCVEVAKEHGVPVCADGGIKASGDMTKAIAAGADTVMLGSLLAGTSESPGNVIYKNGKRYKRYRGSASVDANLSRKEREHKEKNPDADGYTPEGVDTLKLYKGPLKVIIDPLMGGFRSGISYCGAADIKGAQENAEFIRMTSAGMKESNHHDLDK